LTYPEAIQYLYGLQLMGVKLGLDNMVQLCAALDHPQRKLKFIHVAGTNGKGSVCAVLASVFKEAGYRVGLYTSPHLVHFRERIRVNGTMMSEEELASGVAGLKDLLNRVAEEGVQATFFEATTALALEYFVGKEVDLAIWETGLGGRLDATNVVWPECCAITRLGLDHEKILGSELSQIAYEKGGILKQGVPSAILRQVPEAELILRARAQEAGTEPVWVETLDRSQIDRPGGVQRFQWEGQELETKLLGKHQLENLAVALTVCGIMEERNWKVTREALKRGVAMAEWPARFQILRNEPPLVLDGGHNPSGIRAALVTWREFFGEDPERFIFGVLADKPIEEMAAELDGENREIWLVPVQSGRAVDLDVLRGFWKKARLRVWGSVAEAREEEMRNPARKGTLICGSLYLAGEILALMGEEENEVLLNG
jgi:dihydrofolate synthase/folylpolyglutamate synthase